MNDSNKDLEEARGKMIQKIYWEDNLPSTYSNPEYIKIFGENVARRRTELAIPATQLANKVGISHTMIRNIEEGKVKSNEILRMVRIARALDCTPAYLLGLVKNPYAARPDKHGEEIIVPLDMPETMKEDQEIGLIWNLIDNDKEMRKILIEIAILDETEQRHIKNQLTEFLRYRQNAEKTGE